MLMSKKLKPGQPGTKCLVAQYGARLVCTRYCYDAEQRKRFKTDELIIEESLWQPPAKATPDDEIVGLREGVWLIQTCPCRGRCNSPRRQRSVILARSYLANAPVISRSMRSAGVVPKP